MSDLTHDESLIYDEMLSVTGGDTLRSLRESYVAGRISVEEFERRVEVVLRADPS